jgi:hypothetical protein
MIIGGFFNVIYYIIVLEALGGHSIYILLLLECICQYLYLYYLVAITRYLTSKSGEISRQL